MYEDDGVGGPVWEYWEFLEAKSNGRAQNYASYDDYLNTLAYLKKVAPIINGDRPTPLELPMDRERLIFRYGVVVGVVVAIAVLIACGWGTWVPLLILSLVVLWLMVGIGDTQGALGTAVFFWLFWVFVNIWIWHDGSGDPSIKVIFTLVVTAATLGVLFK